MKISQIKKKTDIFHISAQNIDCGHSLEPHRRGGSNEYPQSMFLSRNKKNNVYPCKLQFYCIKVGFNEVCVCVCGGGGGGGGGSVLYRHVFMVETETPVFFRLWFFFFFFCCFQGEPS